jgi:hypothetical protein
MGAMAASVFGQSRVFMTGSNDDAAATATPNGPTNVTANPGDTLTIFAWIQDSADMDNLNAYQLIWPFSAACDGGGSVDYVDNNPGMGGGNTVNIDKTNPDWVFINSPAAAGLPSFFNETPPNIFGVIYNYLPGSQVPICGPGCGVPHCCNANYIAQFQLAVSADCCGTAVFPFNIAGSPPFAAIFNEFGASYGGGGLTFQPLNVNVGPANDDCADAAAGNDEDIPYNTTCATQDGPVDCGSGGDVWFEMTTGPDCDLNVSITGGGTVATYVGANCTPAGGATCGPIVDQPVAGGTHILVQISGDSVSGTLDFTCGGCTSNADCNDNNVCTTDTCNVGTGACANTANSLPCTDNNICTVGDACGGGTCNPGPLNSCNDFLSCTVDSCDPAGAGDGCVNDTVDGDACTSNADCATGTCVDGVGGACDPGDACVCDCNDAQTTCPPDTVCLDVRNCDNGDSAVGGPCATDDDCAAPSPDGVFECGDNDTIAVNGGICVDQCCYQPGSKVVIDLEVGTTSDGTCGVQAFLHYDTSCLTFQSLVIDPDNETDLDFVIVNQKNHTTGDIDLVVSLPPGTICGVSSPNPNVPNDTLFVGGTVARLTFSASGDCKCGGVTFRPHNPPTKVTGPKGDIDGLATSNTTDIQIQGDPIITCPPDSSDHSDCGSIFRTVTYGPVTVSDECEEITADITDLCDVEFRKACLTDLDCGRGDLCGPSTDCGPGQECVTDPLVDGSGFVCGAEKCTGYCTIDQCTNFTCDLARDTDTIDLDSFLDCSDGCQLPPGEITIVCSYTNGCGRTAECNSSHFNSGLNELCVDIELSPSMLPGNPNDPIVRCIDLEISACDAAAFPVCHAPFGTGTEFCSPLDQNACQGHPEACFPPAAGATVSVSTEVVFGLPENIAGHGTACVKIPPGNWTCLTATDPKHSLTSTCTVECTEDNNLHAEFKGSKDTNDTCHWLVQGNLNGGPNIDIADYTILAGEYLNNYNVGGTGEDSPCKTGPVEGNNFHADFNGDGLVTLADWTFVVFNFFNSSKDPCEVVCAGDGATAVDVRTSKPRASMTRAELEKIGLGNYVAAADVDGNGVVDLTDMSQFIDTVGDDGSNAATIEDLKEALRKVERSHRDRELLPRTKRSR